MLSEVEASEKQAWSWLEAANAEKSDRVGDLRQYHDKFDQIKPNLLQKETTEHNCKPPRLTF